MSRTYTLTYDSVTPESAEDNDYYDTGFGSSPSGGASIREGACIDADPNVRRAALDAARNAATATVEPDAYDLDDHDGDESAAAVALMVALILREYGATEPSNSSGGPGTWYTQPDGSTDYRTGETVHVSVHLDSWTPAEQAAIYRAVTRR